MQVESLSQGIAKEGDSSRFLCFTIGSDNYAIPLLHVKEVIANLETTPVPEAPNYFRGLMNLRGLVVSIIDLRLKLKAKGQEKGKETTIIILNFSPLALGVVVDSVDAVVSYENKDISPAPDTDFGKDIQYLTGVARNENSLTLILDLQKALNADKYLTSKYTKAA